MIKNIMPYRLLAPFTPDIDGLVECLETHRFNPCGPLDLQSRGWVPAIPGTAALVHAGSGCYLLRLRHEEKILPASVVREFLDARVAEREEQEMRKVRKREREQLKEEVIFELLPRAFSRHKETLVLIDTVSGWLVVETSSWRQAEEATEFLRESLGSLPIAPPATRDAPQSVMTRWLEGINVPASIELGEAAVFEDPATEGCEVRVKRQDLAATEITGHLKSGKRVRRLALSWSERLSCVVDADYAIRQLRLSDVTMESLLEKEAETASEQFDAEFALYALEIRQFLPALMGLFGGEAHLVEPFPVQQEASGFATRTMPELAGCSVEVNGTPLMAWDESGAPSEPLYPQAVQIVTETQRASVSQLQRRLKIGYNRAARLIEGMEAAGIVGPLQSNGSRRVLQAAESRPGGALR